MEQKNAKDAFFDDLEFYEMDIFDNETIDIFYKRFRFVVMNGDAILYTKARQEMLRRAKEQRRQSEMNELLKAVDKQIKQFVKEERQKQAEQDKNAIEVIEADANAQHLILTLPDKDLAQIPQLQCGQWYITDEGVRPIASSEVLLPTPIIPIARLVNRQDGSVRYKLLWVRKTAQGIKTSTQIVSQLQLAKRNEIVELAKYGININTENAPGAIKYFQDLIAMNETTLPEIASTSKFGWQDSELNEFLPIDKEAVFDGDEKARRFADAVMSHKGNKDDYIQKMRELRSKGKLEINLSVAAAMSSILVRPLGVLSFVVNFYGISGHGKTVLLMVSLSQAGDPQSGALMGSLKDTDCSIETISSVLESLPVGLDDGATRDKKQNENTENLIYTMCNGIGKQRSKANSSLQGVKTHHTCFLTNSEIPLLSTAKKMGAINRVIDIPIGTGDIFEDGRATADFFRNNHNHIMTDYIKAIKEIGKTGLCEIFGNYKEKITKINSDIINKQMDAICCILTADKILTEYVYKDGVFLEDRLDEIVTVLRTETDVADGKRAYDYLLDKIDANPAKMRLNENVSTGQEQWGYELEKPEGTVLVMIPSMVKRILENEGYSISAFLSWGTERGMLWLDSKGNATKSTQYTSNNRPCNRRMYWIFKEKRQNDINDTADVIQNVINDTATFDNPDDTQIWVPAAAVPEIRAFLDKWHVETKILKKQILETEALNDKMTQEKHT